MYGQSATHGGPAKEDIKLLMGCPLATQGQKGKYYHGRPSALDDGRDPTRSAAFRLGPVPAASVPFVAFLARRHPLWWPRQSVAMIVAAAHVVTFPVCVGLHSTELVLRGGSLNGPSVLSGLRVVDDKQFLHLQQSNPVLCKFLTGKAACFRPMAKTSVVEELRKLRDRAYKEALDGLLAASVPAPLVNAPAAPVDDLDLDAPGVEPAALVDATAASRSSRSLLRAARMQVPRTTTVTCQRPGAAPWSVTLLLENGRGAPAMWATSANFDRLLELVRAEIASDTFRRKAHPKASKAEGRRAPRKRDDGSREYFVRGRWVTKRSVVGDDGVKRIRTLKRKPTEESTAAGRVLPRRGAAPDRDEDLDL